MAGTSSQPGPQKFDDYEALEKDLFDYWFLIQKGGMDH